VTSRREAELPLIEDRQSGMVEGEDAERKGGAKAGRVAVIVSELLLQHTDASTWLFGAKCGYRIFPHGSRLVRYPSVSLVRRDRFPGGEPPDENLELVPDLVVEVLSPNDLAEDVEKRLMDYVRVGVPLVWVLYPKTRCVRVLRAGGGAAQLQASDQLSGEDVLPGFVCRVEQLFPMK
jgi:Uma2 family endonuclease